MSYLDKLRESAQKYNSIVSMGIDPVIEALPLAFREKGIRGVTGFYKRIFSLMEKHNVFPGAFKLNQGFFIRHDNPLKNSFAGSRVLAAIIRMIKDRFPYIPVILDYKRADIAASSANYAYEGFIAWGADAVTVSPFMGRDSIWPFIEYCNDMEKRGVYLLNRNSNRDSSDFQNLLVSYATQCESCDGTEMNLYMAVADKIASWAGGRPGVGAVVGATSLDELSRIGMFYSGKGIPILVPGVGAQGGSAGEVVRRLKETGYDLCLVRINSSSGITHPWHKSGGNAPGDWEEISLNELLRLNREIDFRKNL